MTTLVRLAKRAPGLSVADFQHQARRAGDWSAAARHGLRRATQALTLAGAYRRGEPACDVIDELAFPDEASVGRCLADPAFRRAWASPLLDPSSVALLVVEEHVAKPGQVPASFVKNYELVTKRQDLDRAEFDRYWAQVHGPLAARIPTIRRYVQAHLAPGAREAAPCLRRPRHHLVRRRRCDADRRGHRGLRRDEGRRGELPRGRAPVRDHHRAGNVPALRGWRHGAAAC